MDDDIQNLVLSPFQEIVEKGKIALANTTDAGLSKSDEMPKAAQSLVREGERALKKIEPLCKKHWEEYTTNFVVALKENDEIADFRTKLNDLLWDFESFVEVDDFDASEFSKLQMLSRKAAPRIYDILMRMKLEHPRIPFDGFDSAGLSRTTSLAGRSIVSDAPLLPETPDTIEEEKPDFDEPVTFTSRASEPTSAMGAQAGPDVGYEVKQAAPAHVHRTVPQPDVDSSQQQAPESPIIPPQQLAESARPEDIPPEPSVNPWEPKNRAAIPADAWESRTLLDRRPRLSEESIRPSTPPFIVSNAFGEPAHLKPRRLDEGVAALMQEDMKREATTVTERGSRNTGSANQSAAVQAPLMPLPSPPTREEDIKKEGRIRAEGHFRGLADRGETLMSGTARPVNMLVTAHRYSQASSTNSGRSSVFDQGARESMASPVTDPRVSVQEDFATSPLRAKDSYHEPIPEDQPVMSAGWSPTTRSPPAMHSSPTSQPSQTNMHVLLGDQSGLIVAQKVDQKVDEQPGLEPVILGDGSAPGPPNGGPASPVVLREPNCAITVDSSFYQLKGLCDGAKDIIRGGVGVKKIKKAGLAANAVIAKCANKSCMFELEWKFVEADLNKSESANYRNSGIGFRLRFISKSHLVARNIDDHLYGCLFCVQLGRTQEESDATVFPNQKALFSHLARHQRPLPAVPGLTVVESAEIPTHLRDNYDVHFPSPPARSLMAGLGRELESLPVAVATEPFRRAQLRAGPAKQGVAQLQFFAGQRIVGVEFPAKFGGEWALGWADNVRGAFPAGCVRLEVPAEMRNAAGRGGSNLRAVARWKRHPREKGGDGREAGWLRFEKGEVISNISFPYPEHWCWYGSNSKGKYGLFPQSHMEPNTLSEAPGADGTSMLSQESKVSGAAGVLAKFSSIRRRETRPISSAGSHSSSDTATQHSPRPSVY